METNFKKYLKIIQESKTINESSIPQLPGLVSLLNSVSNSENYGNKLSSAKTSEDRVKIIKDVVNDPNVGDKNVKNVLEKVAEIDKIEYTIFSIQDNSFSGVMGKWKNIIKGLFSSSEPKKETETEMEVNLP